MQNVVPLYLIYSLNTLSTAVINYKYIVSIYFNMLDFQKIAYAIKFYSIRFQKNYYSV